MIIFKYRSFCHKLSVSLHINTCALLPLSLFVLPFSTQHELDHQENFCQKFASQYSFQTFHSIYIYVSSTTKKLAYLKPCLSSPSPLFHPTSYTCIIPTQQREYSINPGVEWSELSREHSARLNLKY